MSAIGNRIRVATAIAALTLVATTTASAGKNAYTLHATTADQAAAHAITLTTLDLGSGWTSHAKQPDLTIDPPCAYYHHKVSDLRVTGAGAISFDQSRVSVESKAMVMQTAKMVALDWGRSFPLATWLRCEREQLGKAAFGTARFLSLKRLQMPKLGDFSAGFRVRLDVKTAQGTVATVIDLLEIGRGRTEVELATTMPLADVPALYPNELVWARTLAGRARA